MKIWRICFIDKKGAYRERVYTDSDKLAKCCAKLGVEATIKDAQGEVIGEIRDTHRTLERIPGRRWAWYFDMQNELDTRTYFIDQ